LSRSYKNAGIHAGAEVVDQRREGGGTVCGEGGGKTCCPEGGGLLSGDWGILAGLFLGKAGG